MALAIAVFALAGCASGNTSNSNANANKNNTANTNANANKNTSNTNSSSSSFDIGSLKVTATATVTVEGYDPFTISLYGEEAPLTVENFTNLANQGFYDGLTFYRFVKDFCMQGGSSNNSAAMVNDGLSSIKGEFSSNGVNNALADHFTKGVVAMARSSQPDSATSTFFVTLGSGTSVSRSLNGSYAAFGYIDDAGMAIVDSIVADYLGNVNDASSGSITSVDKQAKIASITVK